MNKIQKLYKYLFIFWGLIFTGNIKIYSFAYTGPTGSTQITSPGSGSSSEDTYQGPTLGAEYEGGSSDSYTVTIKLPKFEDESAATSEMTAEELFYHNLEIYKKQTELLKESDAAVVVGADGYQAYCDLLAAVGYKLPDVDDKEQNEKKIIYASKEELTEKKNSENSSVDGDPVKITEGAYIQEETDFVFGNKNIINLERRYSSDNTIVSSFGYGWSTNLDQRIIFGIEPNVQQLIDAMKTYIANAPGLISEYEKQTAQALHVSSIYKTEEELNARISACDEIIGMTYSILNSLNEMGVSAKGDSQWAALQNTRDEVSAFYSQLFEKRNKIVYNRIYGQWIISYFNSVNENSAVYSENLNTYYSKLQELNIRQNKNHFVMFPGMDRSYEDTGFDTITVIDENSYPHVLYETSRNSGVWINDDDKSVVECRTNRDELWLKKSDGTVNVFAQNGFLSKVVDLNGNYVKINRNPDGKISSVETSEGEKFIFTYENEFIKTVTNARDISQRVIYYYSGNLLSEVNDSENDNVAMCYDSSRRLVSLNKCDGSSIKFSYSIDGVDGKILTTSTTNEENFSEYFEYDRENRKTTYINHDNMQTVYFYDDKHRTVKEIRSDGSIFEYEYGPDDEYLKTTENGLVKTTYFDSKGNKIRVEYDDSSFESFSYDKNNYLILAVDRDGVKSEYIRDEKSNLLEYKISGQTVFIQNFDDKGNVSKRMDYGSQVKTSDYSYDPFGNLILCKVNNSLYQYEYDAQNRIKRYSINGKEISRYSYLPKTTVQTDYNGLERTSKINGRKDVVNITKKDLQTGKIIETKIEYDKRHLPINYYENYGAEDILRFRCLYSGSGNLIAYVLYASGDENNYVWLYSYKNGKITEIHQFLIKGFLQKNITYEELLNVEKSMGDKVYIKQFDYSTGEKNKKILRAFIDSELDRLFEYDNYGNLISTEDANGVKIHVSYTSAGRSSGFQTKNGGWYHINYDSSGNMNYIEDENRNGIAATYYADGLLSSETNQYGTTTYYRYNQNGDISELSTENQITTYKYDDFGRIVHERVTAGNQQEIYIKDYVYSEDGRSFEVTEGDIYTTKYELDAFGNLVKEIDGNGNEIWYTYGDFGKITQVVDGYGWTTKYTWNALEKICTVTLPDKSKCFYEYNYQGQLVGIHDEEGLVYRGEYDKSGRIVKEWNRGDAEKTYEYDKAGNINVIRTGGMVVEMYARNSWERTVSVCDGNGNEYVYRYDELGRLIGEKNRVGEVMEYFYDEAGKPDKKTYFDGTTEKLQYSSDRLACTLTYSDGTQSKYFYDALGNIVCMENENSKTYYEYDKAGLLTRQTDEISGESLEFFYDNAKNRIRMTGSNRDSIYYYGKNGELIEVFDNKQRFGLKIKYDKNGRVNQRIYNNGIVEEITYDRAGRVILIIQKSAIGEVLWAEGYVYGENGKRIATVNEKGAVELYEYDSRGYISKVYYPYSQLLVEKLKAEAVENGLPTVADCGENKFLDSDIKHSIDNLMSKIGYGWDSKITSMQIFIPESYKYDGNGNRIQKKNPFGVVHYTYDSENRLISSGGNGRAYIEYTYNKNGCLLTKESELSFERFEYTADNRLACSEVINKSKKEYSVTNYSYDALGRRVREQDFENPAIGFLYDGFSLDVVKQGPVFKNGNFTDTYEEGIKYSKNGRPTRDRYRYIEDDNSDNNRYFYLDEENYKSVTSRYLGTRNQLYVDGSIIAQTLAEETSYFTKDILGSVRTVFDNHGDVKIFHDYDIFGSLVENISADPNNYGYLSKQYDSITNLYNYGFRDFSPSLARFTTSDPIRDGTNWFTYANNDPVNFVDLWGLEQVSILGNNLMQDERWNEKTLTGTTVEFQKAGCAVMVIADMLNTSPEIVNERYVIDGYMYWSLVAEDMKGSVEKKDISFTMEKFFSQVDNSEKSYRTILKVNWTPDSSEDKHYVGLRDMKTINGKDYAVITSTSYYDKLISNDKFKYSDERIKMGWMVYEGQVLVPVSQIVGYINFEKGK